MVSLDEVPITSCTTSLRSVDQFSPPNETMREGYADCVELLLGYGVDEGLYDNDG
ncbi:hypothetical protein BDV41DRAFT_439992 [Aspergillus transmontanensis]|uniref:Uncharacterized protein n=1 Tax=Aspergillus transmontanensis TaxID=1034304 RepID=A0A5N6VLB3_9EURO|nr:hypothetical protein BDV41DRAFT_439992 [Aspergillus transmontanensis]